MGTAKNGYDLALITRGDPTKLDTLLTQYGKFPDSVVVVNTGIDENEKGFAETNEVAKRHGAKVFHFPWCDDFAKARNFSFEQCTAAYVMWLDTDDTVENPERFDQNIRMAINSGADLVQVVYVYERDQFGNETAIQPRERVVRRGAFRWSENSPIHEVLVSIGNYMPADLPRQGGCVVHDRLSNDHERGRACLRRNKKILEHHFGEGKKPPEARMIFYWGNTLLGLGDHTGALEKYKQYLAMQEGKEHQNLSEKVCALISMATCYTIAERHKDAQKAATEALLISPHAPTPYIELAKIYMRQSDFAAAGMYAKLAQERAEGAKYEMVSSPREILGRSHLILAHCACYAGKYQDALREAEQAKPYFQTDPQFLQLYHEIRGILGRRDVLESFRKLRSCLIEEGDMERARAVTDFAPDVIADHPDVQVLSRKQRPSGKRSIAFVCYPPEGLVPWGPWSIKEGIGGSEEAVINASAELAKLGWHVEVYGHTGRPCREGPIVDAHGVHWYRHEAWSGKHDAGLDVAVSWRSPALFPKTGANAKVKICWLHDIFNPGAWAAGCEQDYDAFFLLSDFHRSLYPMIPDEKVFRTDNGMDPALFVPVEDLKNEPHHMIWGSDPSRGLQFLLPWWKTIKEAVPDATLDIFYGWSQHFMAHMQQSRELRGIYDQVQALRDQPGITWRGKVGQEVLAKEFARAAVLPYMTDFPEIHCITAMKAQAHGCVPVTVDAFALSETVQFGTKMKGPLSDPARQKEYIDRLIEELRNPTSTEQRMEMARWARSKTWASTVSRWQDLFLAKLPQLPVLQSTSSMS